MILVIIISLVFCPKSKKFPKEKAFGQNASEIIPFRINSEFSSFTFNFYALSTLWKSYLRCVFPRIFQCHFFLRHSRKRVLNKNRRLPNLSSQRLHALEASANQSSLYFEKPSCNKTFDKMTSRLQLIVHLTGRFTRQTWVY